MPFELQPYLKGELLELRPLKADDFDDLFAVASDPLIWEQHPCSDRYQEAIFQEFFRDAIASGGAMVVIDRNNGRVIGSSRYNAYDEAKREIEIGWTFLARSHWGGVYNREMKHLMLRHAFRFVDRVIFVIGATNFRSQRAMEKLGGIRAGSKFDDKNRENYIYQIAAATFGKTDAVS